MAGPRNAPLATILAGITAAHLILIAAAAGPASRTELWGVHSSWFLPSGTVLMAIATAVLAGVLVFRAPRFPQGAMSALALALPAAPLFFLLRDRTHLLGDGRLWLSLLSDTRPYHPEEPLAFGGALLATTGLVGAEPAAVASRVEMWGVLVGVAAVFLTVRLAALLGDDDAGRWSAFGLLAGSAVMQLGLGYVEAYPLLWVAVLAFMILAIRTVRGEDRWLGLAAVFGLAVCVHIQALFLFPALALTLAFQERRLRSALAALPLVLLPIVICYVIWPQVAAHRLGESPGGGADSGDALRMFASFKPFDRGPAAWLLYQVNIWSLIAPMALLLIPAGLVLMRRPPDRTMFLIALIAASAAAPILILGDANAWRGGAADWDTFAVSAVPVISLEAWLWSRIAAASARVRAALAVVIAAAFFGTVCFILVNATPTFAVARFENLVSNRAWPPRARSWAYETLGILHRDSGRMDRAIDFYDRALVDQPGNTRLERIRAGLLSWAGRHRESADLYLRTARREPGHPGIWLNLGMELERAGSADSAAMAYRASLERDGRSVETLNYLARLLLRDPETVREAHDLIRESLDLNPGQRNAGEMRNILSQPVEADSASRPAPSPR